MRIYLDPGCHNECTVLFENGNIQTLRGYPEEICSRIKEYVIKDKFDKDGRIIGRRQMIDVYIDMMGIGRVYYSILDNMFVDMKKYTYEKYIR